MPVESYRLETFGKLALTGVASAGLSHQRRRLALLALLAASGETGLSRDQLLAYLWPDSSSANGRHSLEQLLHGMRRAFGESIFRGVNPVCLNSEVIASDVAEFESAFARGALADAVGLFGGPFLQGFYLENAPEFERWSSGARVRLGDKYVEALNRLGDNAQAGGDHAASVRWRRRAVEADPLSSRSALALMRALVAAGDRTAALQHARIYEALVLQEFESAPDPSIVAYAAAVRAGVEQAPADEPQAETLAGSSLTPDATTTPIVTAPRLVTSLTTTELSKTPVSPVSPLSLASPAAPVVLGSGPKASDETHRGRRWPWLLAGIPVVAAILLIAAWSARQRGNGAALDSNKIVIIPFRTSGADSSVNYLREGVVDLIAPMLTGEGGLIAVDSRTTISTWNRIVRGHEATADDARQVAYELGAGLALTGAVVEVGRSLTITGSVISASGGNARPLTSVTGPIDSVGKLLDRFVGQLLTRQSGVAETSVAAITSQSLPAIRAYLNGRAAYRRADEDQAIESFARALDIDSTFALAALDLAVATGKLMRTEICRNESCRVFSILPGFSASERYDDLFDRAARLGWEYRTKLGKRDRPLLDALRGNNYPRENSARETLANLTHAVRVAPDRPETHYLLGTLLLFQGPALALPDSRARSEAAFHAASSLDSSYLAPLAGMVDLAAFTRDTAKLRQAGILYLSRDSAGPTADYVRWLVGMVTPDLPAQRAGRARFRSLNRITLERIYLTAQQSGIGVADADSAAALIIEATTDPLEKSVALRRRELLARNRGRPSQSTELLRRMDALSLSSNFRTFAIAAAMFGDGDRAVGDSAARSLALTLARDTLRVLPRDGVRRISVALTLQSLWYLAGGDTVRAAAAAHWLRRHVDGHPRNRVLFLLPDMLIASRARRPEGAALRALVDSTLLNGCCELPDFVNLVLAQAYEESGDEAGALRIIRRGLWYYPPRTLSTYLREEGKLAARLGDRAGAIRAYEHYLALRSDPEPARRADRDSIRIIVNRLKQRR